MKGDVDEYHALLTDPNCEKMTLYVMERLEPMQMDLKKACLSESAITGTDCRIRSPAVLSELEAICSTIVVGDSIGGASFATEIVVGSGVSNVGILSVEQRNRCIHLVHFVQENH